MVVSTVGLTISARDKPFHEHLSGQAEGDVGQNSGPGAVMCALEFSAFVHITGLSKLMGTCLWQPHGQLLVASSTR